MKIFAAKLSPNTTSESLQALFEQFGEVSSSKVIMDRETGRSKCYGFIEMPDDEQARQALEALNGVEYEGSTIATKEAIPHDDYKKTSGGGFGQRREGGFQRREGGFQRREGGYGHRDSGGGGFRPRREGGSSYGSRDGGFQRRDNYSDRSSGYNRGGYNSHDGGDHSSENNF